MMLHYSHLKNSSIEMLEIVKKKNFELFLKLKKNPSIRDGFKVKVSGIYFCDIENNYKNFEENLHLEALEIKPHFKDSSFFLIKFKHKKKSTLEGTTKTNPLSRMLI